MFFLKCLIGDLIAEALSASALSIVVRVTNVCAASKMNNRKQLNFGRGQPWKAKATHRYVQEMILGTQPIMVDRPTLKVRCNGLNLAIVDAGGAAPQISNHQASFVDEMSRQYINYMVIAAKCRVTFRPVPEVPFQIFNRTTDGAAMTTPNQEARDHEVHGWISPHSSVAGHQPIINNWWQLKEQRLTKWFNLSKDKSRTMTLKWSADKEFGPSVFAQEKLHGLATVTDDGMRNNPTIFNPEEQSYFSFKARPFDAGAISESARTFYLHATIMVEYITIWFEPREMFSSRNNAATAWAPGEVNPDPGPYDAPGNRNIEDDRNEEDEPLADNEFA